MQQHAQGSVAMRRPFKAIKRELIATFERRYLHDLLERHDFDVSAVVRSSGLSRRHLLTLVHKYGFADAASRASFAAS